MGEPTGDDEHRRVRSLIAAGITPNAALSGRAQAAVNTLMARTNDEVDALLAMLTLMVEGRRPVEHARVTAPADGLAYPNPRPTVRGRAPRSVGCHPGPG